MDRPEPRIRMVGLAGLRALVGATAVVVLLAGTSAGTLAAEAPPASADPVLEARVMKLSTELRCLVCQNQTIADSNADLAVDLRNQVRDMLRQGNSDLEVMDYMTARYGDFVLYRPPLKSTTALLWFGPLLLLAGGLLTLFVVLRRRNRMAPEHFDPDLEEAATAVPRAAQASAVPPAPSLAREP